MNHKSSLDFNLLFFALSQLKDQSQREIKPRFIAAKDHFKSALSYHIIGIGRLIETVGMIFIDRQKEKRGIMNLNQASDSLANQDVDIAIYPQGTRAEGNLDRSGKRRDAGYYTTISPNYIDSDYDHIRKGASFLAINTLFSLKKLEKKDPVHIVFIGIEGTATAFPKQSFKIQTETEIEFNIGEILTLDQRVIENIEPLQENYYNLVNDLYEEMDRKLVNSIHIRENLSHRLYLELNGNLRYPENRILKIKENINALDKNTSIVYQILDRIFACSANYWNANLTKLAQILLEENPLSRLQELRIEISQLMLKNLKKKAHGKKVKV